MKLWNWFIGQFEFERRIVAVCYSRVVTDLLANRMIYTFGVKLKIEESQDGRAFYIWHQGVASKNDRMECFAMGFMDGITIAGMSRKAEGK